MGEALLSFDIRTDIDFLQKRLSNLEKIELPWAVKLALDDTAKDVIEAERAEMATVFDNPTDWTLGGLRWSPAEKNGRPASVYFDEGGGGGTPAGRYLAPQIKGGPRPHTPFEARLVRSGRLGRGEYLVPARHAEKDGRGNLNRGQITKILSDLGGLAGIADKSVNWRDRGVRKAERYTMERSGRIPAGIYLNRGRQRLLVFLIVRQPSYRAILDFKGVAERTITARFAAHFRTRLAQAVQTSRYNPGRMKAIA